MIDVGVAECVDEVADFEAADLRDHVGEQCVAGDVKRDTEEDIGAALVELAAQFAAPIGSWCDKELKQTVTRWQGHILDIRRVPRADNMAAGIGGGFDALDDLFELINDFAVRPFPTTPLFAVNGTEVPVLIRPRVPNLDAILLQIGDIRIARDEPEKFMDDRFAVQLLGRDHGKTVREVKAHLMAEHAARPRPRSVPPVNAVVHNVSEKVEILAHRVSLADYKARWNCVTIWSTG